VTTADASPRGAVRRFSNWLFRSRRTGEIVIAQFPNLALLVFLAAAVARRLLDPSGDVDSALHAIGVGALLFWAGDELVRGVNPWRRFLGAAVLTAQLVALA
jgi:hypothetical protein